MDCKEGTVNRQVVDGAGDAGLQQSFHFEKCVGVQGDTSVSSVFLNLVFFKDPWRTSHGHANQLITYLCQFMLEI